MTQKHLANILSDARLRQAWRRVKSNGGAPGHDRLSLAGFESRLESDSESRVSRAGLKTFNKTQHVFVGLFVIDPDGFETIGKLIAQDTLDDIEIVMQ